MEATRKECFRFLSIKPATLPASMPMALLPSSWLDSPSLLLSKQHFHICTAFTLFLPIKVHSSPSPLHVSFLYILDNSHQSKNIAIASSTTNFGQHVLSRYCSSFILLFTKNHFEWVVYSTVLHSIIAYYLCHLFWH